MASKFARDELEKVAVEVEVEVEKNDQPPSRDIVKKL